MNIKTLINSRLFGNISNQFLLYGFSHIVPIILIPFLLNTIGIEKYGLINFAIAFSFYFQIINEFGFDLSNVRHIVNNRNNVIELSRIFSSIQLCKLLILLISGIVYFVTVFIVDVLYENLYLYILAFVRLIGIVITPYYFFRSMEDIKYITKIVLPIKTICILPIFIVVSSESTYIWTMFFYALEAVFSGILSYIILLKRYHVIFKFVSLQNILFFLRDSFPFFTSTFLMRIYKNSNTFILGMFAGDFSAGLYSSAEKLHNAYSSFISPLLSQIFYPYFTRKNSVKLINKVVIGISILNIFVLLLIYLMSFYIIPLFINENAIDIVSYFNMFLLLLALSIPADMLGFPYLGVLGLVKEVNYTTIFATISYLIGVGCLILLQDISISNMIWLLVVSNLVCLLLRISYIYRYKTNVR